MVRLGLAVAGPPIISRSSHVLPVIVPWEKLVVRRDTSAWRDVRQAEGNRMNYDELVRQRKDCRLCVGGGPSRLRNGSPLVYAPEIVSRFFAMAANGARGESSRATTSRAPTSSSGTVARTTRPVQWISSSATASLRPAATAGDPIDGCGGLGLRIRCQLRSQAEPLGPSDGAMARKLPPTPHRPSAMRGRLRARSTLTESS